MKRHLPVIFKGDSVQELQTAIQLIRNDKPVAAEKFREKIIAVIDKIPDSPFIHPECRELLTNSHKYRNAIISPYRIIYKITPASIDILSIFHSSRNPGVLKQMRRERN